MAEKNAKVKIAEYGSWSSPITSEIVVKEGGLPFSPISEVHTCMTGKQGKNKLTYAVFEHIEKVCTCS